ncbi:MAG: exodeoxyribonuclease III [Candidatus Wallbacteria bacterium]|nr:exodeoxyribonuclease III [Candidatus Wallbacteria bacterium]
MEAIRIISWNVNGLRAVLKKGFLEWMQTEQPEILCLQETKAEPEQLPREALDLPGYHVYFASAEKKGYSGVALYTKLNPLEVSTGLGIPDFDREGRVIRAEYEEFILYNIYYPNGKSSAERLQFKLNFYDAFLSIAKKTVSAGKHLIICGDFNTAHQEIDLARPKENEGSSGFLPQERAWIDKFVASGFSDTFRMFESGPGHYSWWDYKTRARERNIGWRIDYFFVDQGLRNRVKSAFILSDIEGSDHCPVGIEIVGKK